MARIRQLDSVIVILTARCNSRCCYCYQTAKKPLSMNWPVLRASIEQVLDSQTAELEIVFLGGEPLLEMANIRAAVEFADRHTPPGKKVGYAISTNGLLITDETAAFLDEHKFEVQLSFDGVEQAQDYRQPGSFASVDRLLDKLKEEHPDLFKSRLVIHAIVVPDTVPFLSSSIRYLIEKGIRQISIAPSITSSPGWMDERLPELESQFRRVCDDSLTYYQRSGDIPFLLFRKREAEPFKCGPGRDMCRLMTRNTLVVDVDGQVYGCVMFAESYQEFSSAFLRLRLAPLKMGGLHDPDLSSRYAAFPEAAREAGLFGHKELKYSSYGKCCECPYLEHCSVCPMSIAYLPGNTDPHRVPDFVCAFNRVALEHRDRFWAYLGDRLLDLETIGGFEWRFSLGGRLRES